MKRWLLLILLCFVHVACAPAEVSSTDASAQSDEAMAAADVDTSLRMAAQLRLSPQAERVEARALVDTDFAGVEEDAEHEAVIVYRVGGDEPRVRAALEAELAPGTKLQIKPALLSQLEAAELTAKLDAEHPTLESSEVSINSWGADSQGGPFLVGVQGDLAKAKALLERRYPAYRGRLQVETSEPVPAGRLDDSSPFVGGDRLYSLYSDPKYLRSCSSGWAAKNSHGTYLITAAHCDCNADPRVWRGDPDHWSKRQQVGEFVALDKVHDAAFVKAPATALLWTHAWSKPTEISFVQGAAHPRVGQFICTSGSFSGLRCGGKVRGFLHIKVSRNTCHGTVIEAGWYADQVHHLSLGGEGDSGGPVFVRTGPREVGARGILSAVDTTRLATCAGGGNQRDCSWRIFFTDIAAIAQRHDFRLQGF